MGKLLAPFRALGFLFELLASASSSKSEHALLLGPETQQSEGAYPLGAYIRCVAQEHGHGTCTKYDWERPEGNLG